ncbi:MAG: response regulator [Myxococcales bacterium]|jgi:DNA-binding response OmpR family regulator|nr:response regulator [Myxococcales bacterium]
MSDNHKTQLGKIQLTRKRLPKDELASQALESDVSEDNRLLKALSEKSGVPAVNLDEIQIQLSDLSILPQEIAVRHVILPFVVTGDTIHLAMAVPDEQRVIDEIEFVSGKKVFPHVAAHPQLVRLIDVVYEMKSRGEATYTGKGFSPSRGAGASPPGPPPPKPPGPSAVTGSDPYSVELDFGMDSALQLEPIPEMDIDDFAFDDVAETQRKILVVDDEDDIRLLISRVLTEKGYKVVSAGRGLEAIALVQKEQPDMIILDAMLPEVHGFDICKKIKGSKKYGHIPVIMISAIYRGWRYAQDLKDSYGVDDFIEKPFKLADLLEKIEKQFARVDSGGQQPEEKPDLSEQTQKIQAASVAAYRSGDIDKAIELLRSGIQIDPLAHNLHYNLALLLGKKNLNYQAIRELESTLELAPDFFPAMKNLALLYEKAGFRFKAIETWERSLHYCPDEESKESIKAHLLTML